MATLKITLLSFIFLVLSFSDLTALELVNPSVQLQVAYINSTELLELVPGKKDASKAIEELNKKYKDELLLMQNDYNSKYTDFLSNQNTLAESIKLRRMQELHELEQSIKRFMKVAQEDIDSQEQQLIVPLKEKLKEAVNEVGIEYGYICIYDLADPTIAFLTPNAVDANTYVKIKLQSK
ncbi:MAG: hypothetical protein RL662_2434 [Bacteroidota bacterium]|jgi:outer membrane protein